MICYKSYRIIDGKPKWVIEDENRNIVDKDPINEQLKGLEKFPEKDGRSNPKQKKSNSELLEYLRQFEKENGRIPTVNEFNENPRYPNGGIYFKKFGGWNNALNLARINIKSKRRIVEIVGRNSTREQLRIIDKDETVDHSNTKCCKCGKNETYVRPNGSAEWLRYRCKEGIWDRKSYLCKKCYTNDYQSNPDSQNNIKKLLANCRNGNLAKNSETGKGLIGEAVLAKTRSLKIINIESDNFNSKIDLSYDNEYGIIQSKSGISMIGKWEFGTGGIRWCDTLGLLCIDRYRLAIIRLYMIPSKHVKVSTITINDTINPRGSKWDKFRIDENAYNNAYQNLMYYLKDKDFFGIKDIKKWLDGGI